MKRISGVLSEMTIDDVRRLKPRVAVMGFGSTEPHGPALPYGTDTINCDGLCRRIVERANRQGARAIMFPTLPIGNNVNFKAFPFAARVRVRTLMRTVLDVLAALEEDGIRKVVLVCGHGGNTEALQAALREHYDVTPPSRRAFACLALGFAGKPSPAPENPTEHGGEEEASQVLLLRPDLVRPDRFGNQPVGRPHPGLEGVYFVRPWHRHVPLSAGGDIRQASAQKGERLQEERARNLAAFVVRLARLPWGKEFPYPPSRRPRRRRRAAG